LCCECPVDDLVVRDGQSLVPGRIEMEVRENSSASAVGCGLP
jgi:hypothetical protein